MVNKKHTIVLDIGTTGIKSFVFDTDLNVVSKAYRSIKKYFPQEGWVEQNSKEVLDISIEVLKEVVNKSKLLPDSFLGLGITNQRETTILWDKENGETVYPAIVWEDSRTEKYCEGLKEFNEDVQEKTGLTINPYFSASKIRWVLDNNGKSRGLLRENRLVFGTVDTWVLWNILDNASHQTDYTNASRTLLFNVKKLDWDDELLKIFDVPRSVLPEVKPSQSLFGNLKKDVLGFSLPILAVCGDQQSSMYGAGTDEGVTKITYGTGTFIMQVLGNEFKILNPFFTALIPNLNEPLYALEGKINCCGRQVDPLLDKPKEKHELLLGLVKDVDMYIKKLPIKPKELIVDGGVTRSEYLVKTQGEVSGISVRMQKIFDGTALGVAKLIFSNT